MGDNQRQVYEIVMTEKRRELSLALFAYTVISCFVKVPQERMVLTEKRLDRMWPRKEKSFYECSELERFLLCLIT